MTSASRLETVDGEQIDECAGTVREAIRHQVESIRRAELRTAVQSLENHGTLSDNQEEQIEKMTVAIVDGILAPLDVTGENSGSRSRPGHGRDDRTDARGPCHHWRQLFEAAADS